MIFWTFCPTDGSWSFGREEDAEGWSQALKALFLVS